MSLWHYGRGSPRMVSIAEAERIRSERISESRTRAGETRKRCSEAGAAAVLLVLLRVAAERSEVLGMIIGGQARAHNLHTMHTMHTF
jgi:hypothetical protein